MPSSLAYTTMDMIRNDVAKMTDRLVKGLDPNTHVRYDKYLVHFITSIEMLNLLLSYGLDLSINKPLTHVSFTIFTVMIEVHGVDPYVLYDVVKTEKKTFIKIRLARDRLNLQTLLTGRLIPDLANIIVDYTYAR